MKMSKFKIAVLVLLVATVIYAVALYQDVLVYKMWKPYWETRVGMKFTLTGFALVSAWSILFTVKRDRRPFKVAFLSLFLIMPLVSAGFAVNIIHSSNATSSNSTQEKT
jgi:Na+/glutamate symporter